MSIRQARLLPAFRKLAYRIKAKRLLGTSIVHWRMAETTETTMTDIVRGWNGTYNSITVANAFSPTGKLCPLFTSNGYAFGLGTYRTSFDGQEGTLMGLAKASTQELWADDSNHYLALIQVDANNFVSVFKDSTNYFQFQYKAGGTAEVLQVPLWQYDWFHWAITWSKSNDRVRFYVNGAIVGSSTGLGTWSGTVTSATISSGSASARWTGWMSDVITVPGAEVAPETIRKMATVRAAPKSISVLGDSISVLGVSFPRWPVRMILDGYNGGWAAPIVHAVGGQSIVEHLAAQVLAAENDDADIIIIHMGANDTDAESIPAVLGAAIDDLRVSNPRAVIYFMNVLPLWTDISGETPINRTAVRAANLSACNAKGVPCWDTFTDPWIEVSDTEDGVHPTEAGHAKIATQILARL